MSINLSDIAILNIKLIIDIEKVLVSNKISFGEKDCKYFIGYLYKGNKVHLREKCPNTEFFLVRIFLYSD